MTFPIDAFQRESLSAVALTVSDGRGNSGKATGFISRFGNHYHLITAKHVVLGLSGFLPSHFSNRKWIPRFLTAGVYRTKGDTLERLSIDYCMFDEKGDPLWKEAQQWDVATFELTAELTKDDWVPVAIDLSEVNVEFDEQGDPVSVSSDDYLPSVAEEVFIVGFPKGLDLLGEDSLPIWKRASIASEPHIRLNDEPIFLVDTFGREGLSGAPVLFRGVDLIDPYGNRRKSGQLESRFRLIGLYAGREGIAEGDNLSLGRVYKRSSIQDTLMSADKRQANARN